MPNERHEDGDAGYCAVPGMDFRAVSADIRPTYRDRSMIRGLGRRQRIFLAALRELEAEHGARRSFYVHAVVRAVWGPLDVAGEDNGRLLRPTRDAEATLNPTRILAGLARRGLLERNVRRGPGSSVRLTDRGRAGGNERTATGPAIV